MTGKCVDVFLDGDLLISYPMSIRDLGGAAVDDAEYIAMAKENLIQDDYSPEAVALATFIVRDC